MSNTLHLKFGLKTGAISILMAATLTGCGTSECDTPQLTAALLGDGNIGEVRTEVASDESKIVGCKATLVIDAPVSDAIISLEQSAFGELFKDRVDSLADSGASITELNDWRMRESVTISYFLGESRELIELSVPDTAMDKLLSAVARASLEKDNSEATKQGYIRVSKFREHRAKTREATAAVERHTLALAKLKREVLSTKKAFIDRQKVLIEADPKLKHLTAEVFKLESTLQNDLILKGGEFLSVNSLSSHKSDETLTFFGTIRNKIKTPITSIAVKGLLWSELSGEFALKSILLTLKNGDLAGYGSSEFRIDIPLEGEMLASYANALIQGGVLYPSKITGANETSITNDPEWADPRTDILRVQKEKTDANEGIIEMVLGMQKMENKLDSARNSLAEARQVLQDIEHERPAPPIEVGA